jgi:hypothetical protein
MWQRSILAIAGDLPCFDDAVVIRWASASFILIAISTFKARQSPRRRNYVRNPNDYVSDFIERVHKSMPSFGLPDAINKPMPHPRFDQNQKVDHCPHKVRLTPNKLLG